VALFELIEQRVVRIEMTLTVGRLQTESVCILMSPFARVFRPFPAASGAPNCSKGPKDKGRCVCVWPRARARLFCVHVWRFVCA